MSIRIEELQRAKAPYQQAFDALIERVAGNEPAWLTEIRKEAFARFDAMGFPHTKMEDWRFTNMRPLADAGFGAPGGEGDWEADKLSLVSIPAQDAYRMVFVNGVFKPGLSDLNGLDAAWKIGTLDSALKTGAEEIEPHLARLGSYENNPFAALNTAFMSDGAVIMAPKGAVLDKPVHVLYLTDARKTAPATHPRTLIVAGADSEFSLIESYAGLGEGYFTNAEAEVTLGENARVNYIRLQRDSETAFHVSNTKVHLAGDANFKHHNVCYGSRLNRNNIDAVLDGENVDCTLNGLILGAGDQHIDNATTLFHEKPHCRSWEMYKTILGGSSQGVFKGKIFVQQDAQKTDAKQNSQGLLMSDKAGLHAMPQLEIYADDVKCTHGATTGKLDEKAIFYCRSRGISPERARAMLTYAFAAEVIDETPYEAVRDELQRLLSSRLPS